MRISYKMKQASLQSHSHVMIRLQEGNLNVNGIIRRVNIRIVGN